MHTTEILPYSVEYIDKKVPDNEKSEATENEAPMMANAEESEDEENVSVSD